jgi:hypothetical protein
MGLTAQCAALTAPYPHPQQLVSIAGAVRNPDYLGCIKRSAIHRLICCGLS